jgi:hypothetical protein
MSFLRWVLMLALIGPIIGCGGTIVPPASPTHPVTVYVADYGRHSTLIMPTDDGGMVEYAFGDWDWLAGMNRKWYRAVVALFFSNGSAFGRRFFDHIPSQQEFDFNIEAKKHVTFEVDRGKMVALRDLLDRQYRAAEGTAVFSPDGNYMYVRDPERYWLFHNCNHVTERWLRELGCDVKGACVTSKFKVAKPRQTTAASEQSLWGAMTTVTDH